MCQGINGESRLLDWQRTCAFIRFSCNDEDRADPGNFGQVLIQGFFSVRTLEILGGYSYLSKYIWRICFYSRICKYLYRCST